MWWILAVPAALGIDWLIEHWECPWEEPRRKVNPRTIIPPKSGAAVAPPRAQCSACLLWDGDHSFACGGLYDDGLTSPYPLDHASVRAARGDEIPAGPSPGWHID